MGAVWVGANSAEVESVLTASDTIREVVVAAQLTDQARKMLSHSKVPD